MLNTSNSYIETRDAFKKLVFPLLGCSYSRKVGALDKMKSNTKLMIHSIDKIEEDIRKNDTVARKFKQHYCHKIKAIHRPCLNFLYEGIKSEEEKPIYKKVSRSSWLEYKTQIKFTDQLFSEWDKLREDNDESKRS